MKRLLLAILLSISFLINSYGEVVNEGTARTVAFNFLLAKSPALSIRSSAELSLIYLESVPADFISLSAPEPVFYVFSSGSNDFIIISGDDLMSPVLGYSTNSHFDKADIPPSMAKWLGDYKKEIQWLRRNVVDPEYTVAEEWDDLKNNRTEQLRNTSSVNPLISTKWDQSPYYNALCPGGSVTGCVATAMAQIMKYWNYPATGSGFHSYNHSSYGTLSANFGATTYNWSQMPNSVNSPNNAVAVLMYNVGVSVEMNYSPDVSGAYVITDQSPVTHCAEYALETYFGYSNSLQGIVRDDYTLTEWVNLLKGEFDAGRPVLYAGFGSGGGHAFVADGYDNNNRIHINWGWGGISDGFFLVTDLDPSNLGSGGGNGGFNSGQQAIIGIKPSSGSQTYDIALYDDVTSSDATIWYGQPFTISTNLANYGNNTFQGDYCAAVFDSQGDFVDFVSVLTGATLEGGYAYQNNLEFSCNGLLSMLPGQYTVSIFYRPTGGNWIIVDDNGSYSNNIEIEVVNPNDIELYSNISIAQGTNLIQGRPANVTLNILNDGSTTFTGIYELGLYNLDGEEVQSIGQLSETQGLPPGYVYSAPYLKFDIGSVEVTPGSYYMAVMHKRTNGDWELTGSSYFLNPILVKVVSAPLQQDQYEANNTASNAFNLSLGFNNNSATVNTNGSNCHNATDYDFYRLNLPPGYSYTITPRLHDAYNSGNGQVYSLDALFSMSVDGTNWSDTYDDITPGSVILSQGGTLYFHVAPYYAGQTGTYLLSVNITRSINVGIPEDINLSSIKAYPNPADKELFIDLRNYEGNLSEVQLLNSLGENLLAINPVNDRLTTLSLSTYPAGLYFLKLTSTEGVQTRKIVISH